MAITFEFVTGKGFHFAADFGARFEVPVAGDRVYLPEFLGTGYIQEVSLSSGIRLCLHHYKLKQGFSLKRHPAVSSADQLILRFDCRKLLVDNDRPESIMLFEPGCEAELCTANFFTQVSFPADQHIDFLVINITRQALVELLQLSDGEQLLKTGLLSNPSLAINVRMTLRMEKVLRQFHEIDPAAPFSALLYQARIGEMIYLFFTSLTGRMSRPQLVINRADIDKLYEVRSVILEDLSTTPNLPGLAKRVSMSPTKMKVLFRQIFGDTIYNYFQTARMNEAARLLKEFSVSETGYKLGFTNLSHFSRVFERHFYAKPKKFQHQQ